MKNDTTNVISLDSARTARELRLRTHARSAARGELQRRDLSDADAIELLGMASYFASFATTEAEIDDLVSDFAAGMTTPPYGWNVMQWYPCVEGGR